jgi:predicted MPP superfamily phosphohydrolase
MRLLELFLCLPALAGHLALCTAFVNRIHAMAMRRWIIDTFNELARLFALGLPIGLFVAYIVHHRKAPEQLELAALPWALLIYLAMCCIVGAVFVPWEMLRRWMVKRPMALVSQQESTHHLHARLDPTEPQSRLGRLLCRMPLNEALSMVVSEKTLELPRLPPHLDGFTIAHISDLHFTGSTPERFFHEVIDIVLEMRADLVAVTGDIVEKYRFFPWIGRTLGRLRAEHGVYYVLGNHDAIIDVSRIRAEMNAAGLIDLGGQCRSIDVNGATMVLAGNELPWITPAADPTCFAPLVEARNSGEPAPLSILLSHSPDQLAWARRHGFDLMLAGHTHGGQIVFPIIGPVLCPSRFGSRYASGTFHEPPTVLHVSRGVGGNTPLRWNCPPEITRLVLASPQRRDDSRYDRRDDAVGASSPGS